MRSPVFTLKKRVYFHDTDSGGVVYYANYLKYMEEARTEFYLDRGIDIHSYEKGGTLFPVVHVEADYKRSALYGDVIDVNVYPSRIGRCSLEFDFEIVRDGNLLVKAKIVWACVNDKFKPCQLPADIAELIKGIVDTGE